MGQNIIIPPEAVVKSEMKKTAEIPIEKIIPPISSIGMTCSLKQGDRSNGTNLKLSAQSKTAIVVMIGFLILLFVID